MPIIEKIDVDESREKVDDVMLAVGAYADMTAIMYHLSGQHQAVAPLASQWMAVLLHKLTEWGAITMAQHDQVMHRIQADSAERAERAAAATGSEPTEINIDEGVQDLLAQLGI